MAEAWLLNLLLYRPGHNGFSRYVQRLLPHLPGYPLWLADGDERQGQRPAWPLRVLQDLTLAQHGVPIRRRLASKGWSDVDAVYSPYLDYLFALSDRPQIITCHDLTPLHIPSTRRAQLRYRLLTPHHLWRANRVIAISRFVADQLIAQGVPTNRIVVIPNGIEIPPRPVQQPLSCDWLVLARHDRNKNVGQVVLAFAEFIRLRKDWPGVLRIVGRAGRATPHVKRLVRQLGLCQRVELVPALAEEDLRRELRSAFALLSPSLMEGFDYPVLEAKAEGIPTLISDIPVHRELHKGSSLFFNSGDEFQALTHSMLRLADDSEMWRQLSRQGRTCATQFTLDRQAASIRGEMRALGG